MQREISLLVVTAILTLAGYSVTDTVVVFDRIRENLRLFRKKGDFVATVNSFNQRGVVAYADNFADYLRLRTGHSVSLRTGGARFRTGAGVRNHHRHLFFDFRRFSDSGRLGGQIAEAIQIEKLTKKEVPLNRRDFFLGVRSARMLRDYQIDQIQCLVCAGLRRLLPDGCADDRRQRAGVAGRQTGTGHAGRNLLCWRSVLSESSVSCCLPTL